MTLDNYGAGDTTSPPLVERKAVVNAPTSGKIAGFVGRVKNNRGNVVYTTRRTGYHFYQKGGGYAISDSILKRLGNTGTSSVFVHEKGSGDVYEFGLSQYGYGEPVPDGDLMDESDPQSYVPLDEATYVWENHADDLFVRSFEDALTYIDNRKR